MCVHCVWFYLFHFLKLLMYCCFSLLTDLLKVLYSGCYLFLASDGVVILLRSSPSKATFSTAFELRLRLSQPFRTIFLSVHPPFCLTIAYPKWGTR